MPNLFLLFSHSLMPEQEQDAIQTFGIKTVTSLPESLQVLWSQVPAELDSLIDFGQPIWNWLKASAQQGDYVLVQGDFGLTHLTVKQSKQLGLIPIYATTVREAKEITNQDGRIEKTLYFQHVRFRLYE